MSYLHSPRKHNIFRTHPFYSPKGENPTLYWQIPLPIKILGLAKANTNFRTFSGNYFLPKFVSILLLIFLFATKGLEAQSGYTTNQYEIILGMGDVIISGQNQNTVIRPSFLLNIGKQWHVDFNNSIGMYLGTNLRNIGFKIKESDQTDIHRVYGFGMPLAIKTGVLHRKLYLYGGGEMEYFFFYKHKQKTPSNTIKSGQWFSKQVNNWMPSFFAGIQFPNDVNLRFSYYLRDFLNPDFSGEVFNQQVDYSQWNTQVFYISVSINFKNEFFQEMIKKPEGQMVRL